MHRVLIMILFSLISFNGIAAGTPERYYLVKNYNTSNGLQSNGIMTICQDKTGYMWFGNETGLSRFDGKTFSDKVIPEIYKNSAYVEYIEKLPDGNIAFTSFMEGIFVQQSVNRFRLYSITPNGLRRNVFNTMKCYPDGSLLVANASSIYHLKDGVFNKIYQHSKNQQFITTLELDPNGNIWFGGALGLGIMLPTETGLSPCFLPEFKDKLIIKILFDQDGILHVGTSQGYYCINFSQKYNWKSKYYVSQPFSELSNTFINHLYIDKSKDLWIPTSTSGVYRIHNSDIILHLRRENGLISSTVLCMYQDKEDNYWFGTNEGISMIKDFNNYSLGYKGEQFNKATDFVKDNTGRIWFFNRDGLYLYQNEKLSYLPAKGSVLEEGGILSLMIDYKSDMWFSNHLGLFRLSLGHNMPDLKKTECVADFKRYNAQRLKSTQIDSQGNIWLCMQNKVFVYFNRRFLSCAFRCSDSSGLRPVAIVRDKWNNYWLGDFSYGLYRMKISEVTSDSLIFDNIKTYKCLKPDSSFVTAWIQDLKVDKEGNIWQPSFYTGVYKLILDSSGVKSYRLYSNANGLSGNMVSAINCDTEGRIWFFSEKGIDALEKNVKTGNETILHFNSYTGMEGQGYNVLTDTCKTYFLFEKGVYVVENNKHVVENSIPPVTISNITINGVADTLILKDNETRRLTHLQTNITFEFASITFRESSGIKYQYKLKGSENTDWCKPAERQVVDYSALAPGTYTFMVRATGNNGTISPVTTYSFRINPPFYRTVWFYTLIIIIFSSVLYSIYKYRIRQLLKMEKMRAAIASDLHDDIGSTLSSIALMSEMIQNGSEKDSGVREMLPRIGENARNMLQSMDDIIWSVDPDNDKFENLQLRVREYANLLFESRGITFVMNSENMERLSIEMDQRRNIFLIIKEALNNAAKHSSCKLATVSFINRLSQLDITITDDGIGFDPETPSSRNGLKNMKNRASQIGAVITILSQPGKGCTVSIKTRNHINI